MGEGVKVNPAAGTLVPNSAVSLECAAACWVLVFSQSFLLL